MLGAIEVRRRRPTRFVIPAGSARWPGRVLPEGLTASKYLFPGAGEQVAWQNGVLVTMLGPWLRWEPPAAIPASEHASFDY